MAEIIAETQIPDQEKINNKETALEDESSKKQKSLDYSIKEGNYASIAGGAGESYIVPYALALNANNAQIGYLSSFVGVIGASWFSLMGDLAPEKERGSYFSKRSKINGTVAMVTTLLASLFLDYMKGLGWVIIGFVILFGIAAFGRFVSAWYFTKHYYPKTSFTKEKYFSFFQFIKKAPGNNFGRFVFFVGVVNIFTNFAGPFFAVYMLKELHFSYLWFTIINISGTLFTIIAIPIWGKIGDKYGNRYLLKVTSFLIPLPPLMWLISGNPIYLIFVPQLLAGFGWGGFNLAASNFIYDTVTPERRGICVSYYTMINGISVFVGAMVGGLFAFYAPASFFNLNVFLWIFLISGIGRAIACLIFIPMIKEVRTLPDNLERLSMFQYLYLFTPRPIVSMWRGVHGLVTHSNIKEKK